MSEHLDVIDDNKGLDPMPDTGYLDSSPDNVLDMTQAHGMNLLFGIKPAYDKTTISLMGQLTKTAIAQKRLIVDEGAAESQAGLAATMAEAVMLMSAESLTRPADTNAIRDLNPPANLESFEISEHEISNDYQAVEFDELFAETRSNGQSKPD